jgi:hypothetical protein
MKLLAQAAIQAIARSLGEESIPFLRNILAASNIARSSRWSSRSATLRLLENPDVNAFLLRDAAGDESILAATATTPTLCDSARTSTPNNTLPIAADVADVLAVPLEDERSDGNDASIVQLRRKTSGASAPKAPMRVTKISNLITSDSRKPAFLRVKCKACGYRSIDRDPKWHKKTGNYIAKKKRCLNNNCSKPHTAIPEYPSIKYVTYSAVMVGISRVGKSYFRPHTVMRTLPSYKGSLESLNLMVKREASDSHLDRPADSEAFECGAHQRTKQPYRCESPRDQNIPQVSGVNKGPFATWQGRKPVISSMGRVSFRVKNNEDPAARSQTIKFSAYGPYLRRPGDRFIDFHDGRVT